MRAIHVASPSVSQPAPALGRARGPLLVAVALAARGLPAEAVDARQAGIRGAGAPGAARIRRIATAPIRRRLQAGVIPVVISEATVVAGILSDS